MDWRIMAKFFSNFNQIQYGNTNTINILERIVAANSLLSNYSVFYPYTMKDGERIDSVAFNYYSDPEFDFLIYIVNNIIDPYYDVPLDQNDFDAFIKDKYGSIANAINTPIYYLNNWASDPSIIDASSYDALPSENKKYWNPNINQFNQVVSYQRKPANWIIDTNMILQVNITLNGNTEFQTTEPIINSKSGNGYVSWANSTILNIQNIGGTWDNSAFTITGSYSNASANVAADSVTLVFQNVSNNELVYYSPISFYDYESQLNSMNKEIMLLDKQYLGAFYKDFKQLLAN